MDALSNEKTYKAMREMVRTALRKHNSIPEAAEELGIGRTTLFRWIKDHPDLAEGIKLPTPGRPDLASLRKRRSPSGTYHAVNRSK